MGPQMLNLIRRALRLIPPGRRARWASLVPLAIAAAALESAGAGVVFALVQVLANPSRAASMPVLSSIVARLPAESPNRIVVGFTAAVVVFYVLRSALLTLLVWGQNRIVQSTAADVATRLFRAYLSAPYIFHLRRNSTTLIHTAGQSVDSAFVLGLNAMVNIVTEVSTALGLIVILAYAAPAATAAAVAAMIVMLVAPLSLTRRLEARWSEEGKAMGEGLLFDLQQSLASLKEVRVMGVEPYFSRIFAARRRAFASLVAREGALSAAVRLSVETAFVCAMLVVVGVVVLRGRANSTLVALLGLYAYVGFRLVPAANRLALNLNAVQASDAHVRAVADDLAALDRASAGSRGVADGPPIVFRDRIEIDSIDYVYDPARGPALAGVSLTIRRGESVGIVGATGSGKSTLVDVLLGLLEPQAGRVLVDGRDIGSHLRSWQDQIGYVPQHFALLDDTLGRNIAFAVPDEAVDPARVDAALRLAHLHEFVAALPRGLDTRIGERGVQLSGGQRQRVAIARALYRDPAVLVFDEATSSLDNQTEREITRAIQELHGSRTIVVVAHRLSTVQGCDRLVFLEGGRVSGDGSYDALLARHAAFRAMVSAVADR